MNPRSKLMLNFFIVVLLGHAAISQKSAPAIGEQAPEFVLSDLSTGNNLTLDSIVKSNIVVIEFWATWCVPCVQAFPHINELKEKFSGKNIIFLSVTYEQNKEKIKEFITKHPLLTSVGLDNDLKMFKDYCAWAIPQTLIIDKNKKLLVSIHPDKINERIIQDILDGKKVNIPDNGKQTYFDPEGAEEYFRKLEREWKN